jgi:catechol 2,3-dioxygenase-like lactoylglutathione lyase family enzyme
VRIVGLDHVSVTTADIQRSLAFYGDLLGIPVLAVAELSGEEVDAITGIEGAKLLTADLDLGRGQVLELIEYVGAGEGSALPLERPGSGHIGLAVEDLDEVRHRLIDAGSVVRSDQVEMSEPGAWHGVRCMTVLDPDGVAVELVQRPRPKLTGETGSVEGTGLRSADR